MCLLGGLRNPVFGLDHGVGEDVGQNGNYR